MLLSASNKLEGFQISAIEFGGREFQTMVSASGLSWLEYAATAGYSINEVLTELGPGGGLEGLRYATTQEVDELMLEHGIDLRETNSVSTGYEALMVGTFFHVSSAWVDHGYYQSDEFSGVNLLNSWDASLIATGTIHGSMAKNPAPDHDYADSRMFHLLVVVPEPGYFGLAAGLLCLFVLIRRGPLQSLASLRRIRASSRRRSGEVSG